HRDASRFSSEACRTLLTLHYTTTTSQPSTWPRACRTLRPRWRRSRAKSPCPQGIMLAWSAGNWPRSMYYPLERVTSDGDAAYFLSVAGRITCKDASFFEAFLCPWTSSLTFYKLRAIEQMWLY